MKDYHILPAGPETVLPNHLLRLGDENQALIDEYVPCSQVYLLEADEAVRGVCVMQAREAEGEIMNVAVEEAYQGQGLGKAMLLHSISQARAQGLKQLLIKTGNSGIGQLALYQRLGFDLTAVNYNYFLEHYPAPIWENGIQCRHQLVLKLSL